MSFYILLGFLAVLFAFEYLLKPLVSFLWFIGVGGVGVWLIVKLVESLKEYVNQLERPNRSRDEDPRIQYQSRPEEDRNKTIDEDHPLYTLPENE